MLLDLIKTFAFFKLRQDDNFVDRLNYYFTATFLIVLSLLVSFKMFGGKPIECWLPAEYTKSWEDYSEMFCWAQNTYWLPYEIDLPSDIIEKPVIKISYYQWVPFFLLIEAMMFYMPSIHIGDLVSMACDPENLKSEVRTKNLNSIAEYLISQFFHQFHSTSGQRIAMHTVMKCLNVRYFDFYISTLYIFVKLLYVLNAALQFYLVNYFLQTDRYSIYGWGVIMDLLNGKEWEESGYFPRSALCDMQIRTLGNVQKHTVQCVLVINIFTEKIFILLWIWYMTICFLNLFNFCTWTFLTLSAEKRFHFVLRNLALADPSFREHFYSSQVRAFVMDHLKLDGVFVLRMLSLHAGAMFTAELVLQIWRIFHPIIREKSTLMREQSRTTVVNNLYNLDDDLTFYDIHNRQMPQDVWPTRISQRLLSAEAAV
ncbi:Innexin-10 [Trichinella nativa]|uniref:Innexin n=1 Tax=Trichinella nativa TaxID=6335 RepID=A0A0V1LVH7_9BILA|nr:Innexin-10 [Trichinella nativa]